jgi:hypothetical protein
MPRISRLSTYHSYKLPKPEEGRFLNGVTMEQLPPDQLLELAQAPYSDGAWAKLVYSVSFGGLRIYSDEYFETFIENVPVTTGDFDYSSETSLTCETPVRCLVYDTTVKSPLAVAQELKFCKGTDLLGGAGVFKIQLKVDHGDESKKLLLGRIAQYSLESVNPFLGLMIVLVNPDSSWELVVGQIHVHKYSKSSNSASIKFALFEPSEFITSILAKMSLKDVPLKEYKSLVHVAVDLKHFK